MTTPVPWSMKKPGPMVAPGWMSMPVFAWASSVIIRGMNGTPSAVQFVGDAVDGDRLEAGIAEDDLVVAARRGVAAEGGLHVVFERLAHVRQAAQQLDRLRLGDLLAIDVRGFLAQLVAQRAGDLLGQLVVQGIDEAADVVADVPDVQVLPLAVAGVEHLEEVGDDVGDRVAVRQRFVREVVQPAALGVRLDQLVGDRRQLLLESDVRGHDDSGMESRALIWMLRR